MKKEIFVLLDKTTPTKSLIKSAIQFALQCDLKITLCFLVEGPSDWELLSRSTKMKHGDTKTIVQEARLFMDQQLKEIRSKNVEAGKCFVFYQGDDLELCTKVTENAIIILSPQLMVKNEKLAHLLQAQLVNLQLLFVPDNMVFNLNKDLIVATDFSRTKNELLLLIEEINSQSPQRKELVYINTPDCFENSEVSLKKMKNTIVQHGLSKTRMSVFNSDNRTHGILSLTQIKDAGFALVEFTKKPDFEKLTDLALPLFIRYFSHEA